MKLTRAKLCSECDEIFDGLEHQVCPFCGEDGWNLSAWIPSLNFVEQIPASTAGRPSLRDDTSSGVSA